MGSERTGQWIFFSSSNAFDFKIVDCHQAAGLIKTQAVDGLPPIHPGEYVLEELGMSQAEFARTVGESPMRISHLARVKRRVMADLTLRLGRALGQSPQYWLNLQTACYLKVAPAAMKTA